MAHLRGVSFSGGYPNLAAGVDVDAAVRGARDGRAYSVGDANAQRASRLGVLQRLHAARLSGTWHIAEPGRLLLYMPKAGGTLATGIVKKPAEAPTLAL